MGQHHRRLFLVPTCKRIPISVIAKDRDEHDWLKRFTQADLVGEQCSELRKNARSVAKTTVQLVDYSLHLMQFDLDAAMSSV